MKWLGWVGIVIAIIGFIYSPVCLGLAGMVLGTIGMFGRGKGVAWWAILFGLISFVFGLF